MAGKDPLGANLIVQVEAIHPTGFHQRGGARFRGGRDGDAHATDRAEHTRDNAPGPERRDRAHASSVGVLRWSVLTSYVQQANNLLKQRGVLDAPLRLSLNALQDDWCPSRGSDDRDPS